MLYRLSGVLADNNRFSARIEAPDPISAIGSARTAFQEGGVQATDIARLSVRPAKGGKTLRISKPREKGAGESKPRRVKKSA